jgi:hypothetical protein
MTIMEVRIKKKKIIRVKSRINSLKHLILIHLEVKNSHLIKESL